MTSLCDVMVLAVTLCRRRDADVTSRGSHALVTSMTRMVVCMVSNLHAGYIWRDEIQVFSIGASLVSAKKGGYLSLVSVIPFTD